VPVEAAGTTLMMTMIRRSLLLVALLSSLPLMAAGSDALLARALPAQAEQLAELGRGVGIVFTPDLSVKDNCSFYQALGFACFDGADWMRIVANIHAHNTDEQRDRIHTLVLETHGTNGNGLKLQDGKDPADARSYIAVAALEEMLAPVGVQTIVISACNSGRLLRPEIYRRLDRNNGDKLFLPATKGIIDASATFDSQRSEVTVITPGASQIETTLVGSIRELSPSTRAALEDAARTRNIALRDFRDADPHADARPDARAPHRRPRRSAVVDSIVAGDERTDLPQLRRAPRFIHPRRFLRGCSRCRALAASTSVDRREITARAQRARRLRKENLHGEAIRVMARRACC
jgi:hypothetical protein